MVEVANTLEIEELLRWIGDSNCGVKVGLFPRGDPEVENTYFVRGLGTSRPISAGDVLCSVSIEKMVFTSVAASDPFIASILEKAALRSTDDDLIASLLPVILFLLMHSKRCNLDLERDFMCYVNTLPQEYDLPQCWSDVELTMLEGSPLLEATRERQHEIQFVYDTIYPLLLDVGWELSYVDFHWAICTVISRYFVGAGGSANREVSKVAEVVLIPFIDFANHDPAKSEDISINRETESLELRASRDYEEGEEVFVFYNRRDNNFLLQDYGFLVEQDTEFVECKLCIRHGCEGIDGQWEIDELTEGNVQMATYTFSRDTPDWERCGEALCQELYHEGVRRLSLYTTSLEDDQQLLSNEAFLKTLGARQQMAFAICLEEKKMLAFLMEHFTRQWWDFQDQKPQQITNDGDDNNHYIAEGGDIGLIETN